MKAKLGSIVVSASGKLSGHIVHSDKSGVRLITKPNKVDRNSSSQVYCRSWNTQLSDYWKTISQSSRQTWLNESYRGMSGYNLFYYCNFNLFNAYRSIITEFHKPATFPEPFNYTLNWSNFFQTLYFEFDSTISTSFSALYYLSRLFPSQIAYPEKFLRKVRFQSGVPSLEIYVDDNFETIFGFPLLMGRYIFGRVDLVDRYSGFLLRGSVVSAFISEAVPVDQDFMVTEELYYMVEENNIDSIFIQE